MKRELITKNSKETQALGRELVAKIKKGGIVCLEGDLGSGKTTFTQGLLKGLKINGPHTSPTFMIIKEYKFKTKLQAKSYKLKAVYHIDAYRVKAKDILSLGWKELIAEKNNIIIIEWADRIRKIIPRGAVWIKFENISEDKRKITFK